MITAAHRLFQVGGFSPLSLAPALWYLDNGADTSVWTDFSGNARNATQATVSRRPSIQANIINTRQVRRFDGVNTPTLGDFLSHPWDETSSFTFHAVLRQTTAAARQVFGAKTSGAVTLIYTSAGGQWGTFSNAGGATFIASGQSILNTWSIITFIKSGSTFAMFTNGATGTTSASFTPYGGDTNNRRSIGGFANPVSEESYGGDIAEIIVVPYAENTSQRQLTERYLANKYAITI